MRIERTNNEYTLSTDDGWVLKTSVLVGVLNTNPFSLRFIRFIQITEYGQSFESYIFSKSINDFFISVLS